MSVLLLDAYAIPGLKVAGSFGVSLFKKRPQVMTQSSFIQKLPVFFFSNLESKLLTGVSFRKQTKYLVLVL